MTLYPRLGGHDKPPPADYLLRQRAAMVIIRASDSELDEIIDYCMGSGTDGIVAGNTTRSRDGLTNTDPQKIESIGNGGLSGAPIFKKNLELVRYISERSGKKLPVVGVGGIMSPEQAKQMLDAGASLVEIYSGFIYEGPSLVKRINKYLENAARSGSEIKK